MFRMIAIAKPSVRFRPGQVVMTPGASDALAQSNEHPLNYLRRHLMGDWGEVCEEDARSNEEALDEGLRVLSAYRTKQDIKLWVITEADRSVTTLLLPEEY